MMTHAEVLGKLAEWIEENPVPAGWSVNIDLTAYGFEPEQAMNIHTHGNLQAGKDLFPGVDWDETNVRTDGITSYVTGEIAILGLREVTVFN